VTGDRVGKNYATGLLNADPPIHTPRKAKINKLFTTSRCKELEPKLRKFAQSLISSFKLKKQFDVFRDYAIPLTIYMTLEIVGLPEIDFEELKKWSISHAIPVGNPYLSKQEERELIDVFIDFKNYFSHIIEREEVNPGNNLISYLMHSQYDGDQTILDKKEIILTLRQLLAAGIETTSRFLVICFYQLIQNKNALKEIIENPSMIDNFLEEVLRISSPIHGMFRTNSRKVNLAGTQLPADAMMLLMYTSAGLEESTFKCPFQFDHKRKNAKKHLGFGIGLHFCPGSQLAKIMCKLAIEEIIAVFSDFSLVEENVNPLPSYNLYGFESFKLAFKSKPRSQQESP
jgi:cytochrome P450